MRLKNLKADKIDINFEDMKETPEILYLKNIFHPDNKPVDIKISYNTNNLIIISEEINANIEIVNGSPNGYLLNELVKETSKKTASILGVTTSTSNSNNSKESSKKPTTSILGVGLGNSNKSKEKFASIGCGFSVEKIVIMAILIYILYNMMNKRETIKLFN